MGIIAYKVVDKETRYGTNAALMLHAKEHDRCDVARVLIAYEQFFPKYERDAFIECVPNSPGVCCFETIEDAQNFIRDDLGDLCYEVKIIKVEGLKRLRKRIYTQIGDLFILGWMMNFAQGLEASLLDSSASES